MATMQFKLPIGAKRQVTIPRDLMNILSIEEGSELLLNVVGDHVTLTPLVSVPRNELPQELRLKFEARRGEKSSDVTLSKFLSEFPAKPKSGV
jgi:bifunctional DNA-binding transcriptional regulator/antitoxin component of YhaV-PrlF toxin-antitoxin module